jgi:hypothetical protein
MRKTGWIAGIALAALLCGSASTVFAKPTKCHIRYTLKGWAVVYESSSGSGTITCDNGQSAKVVLKSKGAGVAFGKETILDGEGAFSEVGDISELFGHYVALATDAGSGKAADSQVMTKGEISLALAGKGKGMEVAIAFGDFDITKAE